MLKKLPLIIVISLFALLLFSCTTTKTPVKTTPSANREILQMKPSTAKEEPKTEEQETPVAVVPVVTPEKIETPVEPVAAPVEPEVHEEVAELPSEPEATVEAIVVPTTPIPEVDFASIIPAFNYAYGINAMEQLKEQGISFNALYFARGVIDACEDTRNPSLVPFAALQDHVDNYIYQYYQKGISFEPGQRPEAVEEITSLTLPNDVPSLFSYSYAYLTVIDLIESEVEILPYEFLTGALDSLYEVSVLDANGVQTYINNYILYLNEIYYQEQASLGDTNYQKAKAFLEANGKREDIITLGDGIQIEVIAEDDELGPYPRTTDTVLIDYNLYALDYESEELNIIDADFGVELLLEDAITSLKNTVLAMKVGQAVRSYIPPEISIDDTTIYDIEPNTLLIYDVALNDIL